MTGFFLVASLLATFCGQLWLAAILFAICYLLALREA